MRKGLGLLFAISFLLPVGILSASPAGAVAGTTCKAFKATETANPALPIYGKPQKVNATVKVVGKLTGCSGGGVTGASVTQTYKYNGNCTTLISGKGGKTTPAKPTTTYAWSNHTKSTATTTTTTVSKAGATPVKVKVVTKITSGQFKGASATTVLTATSPKGSCVTIPGKTTTLTGGKATFK